MREYIVIVSVWCLAGLSAYGQCVPPTSAQSSVQFNDGQEVRVGVDAGQPGDRFLWYDQAVDGEVLTEGTVYFPMLACGETRTFYVARVNDALGCVSARLAVSGTRTNNNCRHWTSQQLFDENGNVYSEGIQYADDLGRPTQTQARNLSEGRVLAVQRLYDAEGAPVVQTLPAPTAGSALGYQQNFVTNATGQPYGAIHFDAENGVDKKDSPDPVGNTVPGTLGWYYSTNNTLEPLTPASSYPYSRSWVEDGPDPKVSEAAGPGDAYRMGAGHTVRTERTYSTANVNLRKYYNLRSYYVTDPVTYDPSRFDYGYRLDATDPDGTQTQTTINARGETVISGIRHDDLGGDAYDYGYAYYNERGQTVATVMPQGVAEVASDGTQQPGYAVTNEYHPAGWLLSSTDPDQGLAEYVYSDDGKLRFSQDARQRLANPQRFSYTLYDRQDRLIESGEYVQSGVNPFVFENHAAYEASVAGGTVDPGSVHTLVNLDGLAGALDVTRTQDVSRMVYDVGQADLPVSDQYTAQQFVFGKVAKTERLADDESVIASSWYSYDAMGRLAWMVQQVPGVGVKTVDYTYDFLDNVVQTTYQRGSIESFTHVYSYDADNRLSEVHTSLDEGSTRKLQATYEYYLHGPLKRIALAEGVQGLDMVYTIQGWLKGMNNGDLSRNPGGDGVAGGSNESVAQDVFGMTLDYFQATVNGSSVPDYQSNALPAESVTLGASSNQFGGQLQGMRWSSPSAPGQQVYEYLYDDKYQLTQARYGSVSASGNSYTADFSGNRFNESVSYRDRHGYPEICTWRHFHIYGTYQFLKPDGLMRWENVIKNVKLRKLLDRSTK